MSLRLWRIQDVYLRRYRVGTRLLDGYRALSRVYRARGRGIKRRVNLSSRGCLRGWTGAVSSTLADVALRTGHPAPSNANPFYKAMSSDGLINWRSQSTVQL